MREIMYAFTVVANGKLEPGYHESECIISGKVIYKITKC